MEARVFNVAGLVGLDSKTNAVRIGSTVGKKKRAEIGKKAAEMKLRVLNK